VYTAAITTAATTKTTSSTRRIQPSCRDIQTPPFARGL
jgi:hypothetical protein